MLWRIMDFQPLRIRPRHCRRKLGGDEGVGHPAVCCLIDVKQNVGVLDFLSTALAGRNEFRQESTLCGGQGYCVNLLHRDFPVRTEKRRIQITAKQSKCKMGKFRNDRVLYRALLQIGRFKTAPAPCGEYAR